MKTVWVIRCYTKDAVNILDHKPSKEDIQAVVDYVVKNNIKTRVYKEKARGD